MEYFQFEKITTVVEHLVNQYSYFENQPKNLEDTIKYWLIDKYCINVDIELLYNNVLSCVKNNENLNEFNINHILDEFDKISIITQKMRFFQKYKLTDFQIINSASDFYGKSVEYFCDDIMEIFNYDLFEPIKKYTELYQDLMHLIKCDILTIIGILFYYLKITTITNDFYMDTHNLIGRAIVSYIANIGGEFDIDKIIVHYPDTIDKLCGQFRKNNREAYFLDFHKNVMEKMYDMYFPMVSKIKFMNEKEVINYTKEIPDYQLLLILTGQKLISKKYLYKEIYYLMAICQDNNIKDNKQTENIAMNITSLNVTSLNNIYLKIEI